jgi:hypothetical protein
MAGLDKDRIVLKETGGGQRIDRTQQASKCLSRMADGHEDHCKSPP